MTHSFKSICTECVTSAKHGGHWKQQQPRPGNMVNHNMHRAPHSTMLTYRPEHSLWPTDYLQHFTVKTHATRSNDPLVLWNLRYRFLEIRLTSMSLFLVHALHCSLNLGSHLCWPRPFIFSSQASGTCWPQSGYALIQDGFTTVKNLVI